MTRAEDHLHLVMPQRFFTHNQHPRGDRHVYTLRTRFITSKLLKLFECTSWSSEPTKHLQYRAHPRLMSRRE